MKYRFDETLSSSLPSSLGEHRVQTTVLIGGHKVITATHLVSVDENLRNGCLADFRRQGLTKSISVSDLIQLHQTKLNALLVEHAFGLDAERAPALREQHDLVLGDLCINLSHWVAVYHCVFVFVLVGICFGLWVGLDWRSIKF